MKSFTIKTKNHELLLNKPKIMGVLNITPDSFCTKSRCKDIDDALYNAEKMLANGADILDVGGESTSKMVKKYGYNDNKHSFVGESLAEHQQDSATSQQELDRVVPVVESLVTKFDCVVSVDTSTPEVMAATAAVGASIINDIRALERPGAIETVKKLNIPVILMHSLVNHPKADFKPQYNNVVTTVLDYLQQRIDTCVAAGISKDSIIVDPGFGGGLFGKLPQHDHSLIKHLTKLHNLERPILIGVSRKSAIGAVINKPPEARLAGSLALGLLAAQANTHILRVHDVEETSDVLKMLEAIAIAE